MVSFREVKGPFPVGCATFVYKVRPEDQDVIGTSVLKADGQPAVRLEEVRFKAYYPAHVSPKQKKGVRWVTRPVRQSLRGFARFAAFVKPVFIVMWPFMYILSAVLEMPFYKNAALLDPSSIGEEPSSTRTVQSKRWPLVIFSHGLGGNGVAYSQLCASLAAEGRVIIVVEHRDGTEPMYIDSSGRVSYYLRDKDVVWGDDHKQDATDNPLPLRTDQLTLRRREIYLVYTALFDAGCGGTSQSGAGWTMIKGNLSLCDWKKDYIHTDDVTLAGHSFGGATVLSILSNPPLEGNKAILVRRALVLDPWLEPFSSPGPLPYDPQKSDGNPKESVSSEDAEWVTLSKVIKQSPPMLVLNSETFTLWDSHLERLKTVIPIWQALLLTIVGSGHESFSDYPFIPFLPVPGFDKGEAVVLMNSIILLCSRFLNDHVDPAALLEGVTTRNMETLELEPKKRNRRRKLVGDTGDVIVH